MMQRTASAMAMDSGSNVWDHIKARLAAKISAQAYENWIMRTAFEGLDQGVLRVTVPDQVTKDCMEQEYCRRHSRRRA